MLISHKNKFVFIHIFKTAGTSVRAVLKPHARFIDRLVWKKISRYYGTRLIGPKSYHRKLIPFLTGFKKHDRADQAMDYLGKDVYNSYFSFAFVRNPYDWMISLYHFIRGPRAKNHDEHELAKSLSFSEFLKYKIENGIECQSEFVTDVEGRLIVDFIGKFENLEEDTAQIFEKIKIPFSGLPHQNESKGREKKNYHDYYNEETTRMMQEHFKNDFEMFDYDKSLPSTV